MDSTLSGWCDGAGCADNRKIGSLYVPDSQASCDEGSSGVCEYKEGSRSALGIGMRTTRLAHNLGSGSTPKFFKKLCEIVKIHEFSLIFHHDV